MPTRIDHVIIAAPDLTLLEETFTRLGFTVVGGGTHPHLGTRNRIVVLGDGYIELLAIADTASVSPTLRDRIAHGGGWVGYALQSDNIAAEASMMRQRGADVRGPTAGQLLAPDGTARSWQVVTVGAGDLWAAAFPLPFLIQHDSAGARHQRELAGADALTPHANGSTRLLGVSLRVTDLATLRDRYERAYALTPATAQARSAAEEGVITYPLARGREWISLIQPRYASVAIESSTGPVDSVMSVRVGVADLAPVERAIWHAGFAATPVPGSICVTLPTITATLDFSVSSLAGGQNRASRPQ
ncbi:MAG TPA: VOC family protein [Ktedonobacterales bacterium]